jgi:competence protein ComEA
VRELHSAGEKRILARNLIVSNPELKQARFRHNFSGGRISTQNPKHGGRKMKGVKKFFVLAVVVSVLMALVPVALAEQGDKININEASVTELMKLKKIGQKYAERIVAYREKNGPFQKPEDIVKVKGIGQKTFELNADKITVE